MPTTLALSQFFDVIDVASEDFHIRDDATYAESRGGTVYSSRTSPVLWTGSVRLAADVNWGIRQKRSLLNTIMQPDVRFLIYARSIRAPLDDLSGSKLGAATPFLSTVHSSRTQIRIGGLPPGYKLSPGDCISWPQAGPVTQRYHQIEGTVTANASGLTPLVTVFPAVHVGFVLNSPVELIKPRLRAVYLPGSFKPYTSEGPFSQGASFSWLQTLE